MDEGIVEGCEDTGNTEDEFTWWELVFGLFNFFAHTRGIEKLTISDLRAEGDVLLGGTGDFLWRHVFDLRFFDFAGE